MTTQWLEVARKCADDLKRPCWPVNQMEAEVFVAKLYQEGFSARDIIGMAGSVSTSTTSIYNMLKRHKVKRRTSGGDRNVKIPYIPVSEFAKHGVAETARRNGLSYFQAYRQFKAYKQQGLIKERSRYYVEP